MTKVPVDVSRGNQREPFKKGSLDITRFYSTFQDQRYMRPEKVLADILATDHSLSVRDTIPLSLKERIERSQREQCEREKKFDEMRNDLNKHGNRLCNKSVKLTRELSYGFKKLVDIMKGKLEEFKEIFEDIQDDIARVDSEQKYISKFIKNVERYQVSIQDTTLSAAIKHMDVVASFRLHLTREIALEKESLSQQEEWGKEAKNKLDVKMQCKLDLEAKLSIFQTGKDRSPGNSLSLLRGKKESNIKVVRKVEVEEEEEMSIVLQSISDLEEEVSLYTATQKEMREDITEMEKCLQSVYRYETYLCHLHEKVFSDTRTKEALSDTSTHIEALKKKKEEIKKSKEEINQKRIIVTEKIVRQAGEVVKPHSYINQQIENVEHVIRYYQSQLASGLDDTQKEADQKELAQVEERKEKLMYIKEDSTDQEQLALFFQEERKFWQGKINGLKRKMQASMKLETEGEQTQDKIDNRQPGNRRVSEADEQALHVLGELIPNGLGERPNTVKALSYWENELQVCESIIHSMHSDEMSLTFKNIESSCLVKIEQGQEKKEELEKKYISLKKQIKQYEENIANQRMSVNVSDYFDFFAQLHQCEKELREIQHQRDQMNVVYARFKTFRRASESERTSERYATDMWKEKLRAVTRRVTVRIADFEKEPVGRDNREVESAYLELLEAARFQGSASYFTRDVQGHFNLLQEVLKIPQDGVMIPQTKREELERYQIYIQKLVGKKRPVRVNAERYQDTLDIQAEYLRKQQEEIEAELHVQEEQQRAREGILLQDHRQEFSEVHAEHQAALLSYLTLLKEKMEKHEEDKEGLIKKKKEIGSAHEIQQQQAEVFMDGDFDMRLRTLRELAQGKQRTALGIRGKFLEELIAKMEYLEGSTYRSDMAELAEREWQYGEALDEERYHVRESLKDLAIEQERLASRLQKKRANKPAHPLSIVKDRTALSQITEYIDHMKEFESKLTEEIKAVHERLKGRLEMQGVMKHYYLLDRHILPASEIPTGFAPESGQKVYVTIDSLACTQTAIRIIVSDKNPQLAEREEEIATAFQEEEAVGGGMNYVSIPKILKKLGHPVAYKTYAIASLYDVIEKLQFDHKGRCLPFVIGIQRPEIPDSVEHSIVCDGIFEMNVNRRVEMHMMIRDPLLEERFFARLDHLNEVFCTKSTSYMGLERLQPNVVLPVIDPGTKVSSVVKAVTD